MGCYEGHGAVMNCDKPKRWIKHANSFQPQTHGTFKYQAQCIECGATGAFQKTCPNGPSSAFSSEEAKVYRKEKEEERRLKRQREEDEREERAKNKQIEWRRKYNEHLNSEEWQAIRALALKRDKHLCQGCMTEPATEVHHLSYENMGQELLWELISTCRACHAKVHAKTTAYDRLMEYIRMRSRLDDIEDE